MFFEVETFAGTDAEGTDDGPVSTATFNGPNWLTVSPSGVVYVAETLHNGIRKIEGGVVSTLASRAGQCRRASINSLVHRPIRYCL